MSDEYHIREMAVPGDLPLLAQFVVLKEDVVCALCTDPVTARRIARGLTILDQLDAQAPAKPYLVMMAEYEPWAKELKGWDLVDGGFFIHDVEIPL